MSETTLWTGLIIIFVAVVFVTMFQENRRRQREFLQKIKKGWGQIPDREYTWDKLEQIGEYFRRRKDGRFVIDDITWNDLDMDRVFMLMNQTISSPGEDYLYYLLRTPEYQEEKLAERERLYTFFREHEKERQKVQEILAHIRKPPSSSVYQAIHVTKEYDAGNPWKQILMCLAFLLSIGAFIAVPRYGVFVFLLVTCINMGTYLKDKEVIQVYLTGFKCMLQLINCAGALDKLKIEELHRYTERLNACEKGFSGFRNGANLVLDRDGFASGPESFILDYIRMMTHIDLIKFNSMMKAMKEHKAEAEEMLEIYGLLDACISIASFREAMPYYCVPDFTRYQKGSDVRMKVENLYHPLIHEPVANSIDASGGILVTGSNASGKSTFLKNVAMNAILAQTVYTCTATEYAAPFFKIQTSMALRDDLESKESYYIVEIKSLKRILEESKEEAPLLCIIDEVLRGTNTIERIAASSNILAHLKKPHVLPFAATHDIELSYMLEGAYTNYHFEEEFREDDVEFNYLLKKGRVTTRNAIRLLSMVGYDREIVEESEAAVADFETTGIWKKVGNENAC